MTQVELDIAGGALRREGETLPLRPKTLAVLLALIERQGETVSQDELRRLIWGNRHGSDAGPKQCIRELRRLLGDSATAPRFIETVGRYGYRLSGQIDIPGANTPSPSSERPLCVGRERELEALTKSLTAARRGNRAIALIAGESGAGKTRLVDSFLATLTGAAPAMWIAHGQCLPHPGAREPYGPLLEILSQIVNARPVANLPRLLRETAPTWLGHLPGADHGHDPATFDPGQKFGPDRPDPMPREFTLLMERITREQPGILVLEDLHWSDQSTLAWLCAWGLQRTPARLMVLVTYRFDEVDTAGELATTLSHLNRQPGIQTLTLEGLGAEAVHDYLAQRFPGNAFPPSLAAALAHRTEGHAILVEAVTEQWLRNGDIGQAAGRWQLNRPEKELVLAIAPGVRDVISAEIGRLTPAERQLLEAASVAGPRFSAAAMADTREAREDVEHRLENLARNRRFIEQAGVSQQPDGTLATRYAFRHALYHEAIYDGIPAAIRQGLHQRIGDRLETIFASDTAEVATTLADHFERAADWLKAARYRGLSGIRALDRGAAHDAATQLRQALALHERCPDADRSQSSAELRTLLGLGAALIVSEGFTREELRAVYKRASTLALEVGDPAEIAPVLAGMWNYHLSRAEFGKAEEIALGLRNLSANVPVQIAMATHNAIGQTAFFTGSLAASLPEINAALSLHEGAEEEAGDTLLGENAGIVCRQYAACVQQILGNDAEADAHLTAGMREAEALDQPFGQAQMFWAGAIIARERGDAALTLERAQRMIETCRRADIPYWIPPGNMLAGWARAMLGDPAGEEQLRNGLTAYEAMNARLTLPYGLGLFAEVLLHDGRTSDALNTLRRALRLVRSTGECWYEAELHRLWAKLAQQTGRPKNAQRALERALNIARRQGAIAFEKQALAQLAEISLKA